MKNDMNGSEDVTWCARCLRVRSNLSKRRLCPECEQLIRSQERQEAIRRYDRARAQEVKR